MPSLTPSLSACWACGVSCSDLIVRCTLCQGKCNVICPIAFSPSPSHSRCPRCSGHRIIPCPRCWGIGKQRLTDENATCEPCAQLIQVIKEEDEAEEEDEDSEDEDDMEDVEGEKRRELVLDSEEAVSDEI